MKVNGAVSRGWLLAAIVAVVALTASPLVAQDLDLDEFFEQYDNLFAFDPPRRVAAGTTVTLSGGVRPGACKPGTAEVGFDPARLSGSPPHNDRRSGQQVAVAIPDSGPFTVELAIPSGVTEGDLYITCEWTDGFEPGDQTSEWSAVTISAGPAPGEQPSGSTPEAGETAASGELEDDDFLFELRAGTGPLLVGGQASGPATPGGGDVVLAAPVAGNVFAGGPISLLDAAPVAVRVPRGTRCVVSTCLWGYFTPPYYGCTNTVFVTNFGRSRYGSMTGYGYIRKGLADYVKARPLFYEDGRLIKTGGWQRFDFFHRLGQPWEAWYAVKLHMQFPSPNSSYQVGFQAQWWQEVPLWGARNDRHMASTAGASVVPYGCFSGP